MKSGLGFALLGILIFLMVVILPTLLTHAQHHVGK